MPNLILQHYDGILGELEKASVANIKAYAKMVGADYRLIVGRPFRKWLEPAPQKCYMINEEYDKYDDVLMLDIDMFAPVGMEINVFDQVGVGMYNPVQQMLHNKMIRLYPEISSADSPYWGGAIYKMSKELRKTLRSAGESFTSDSWLETFTHYHFADEGIFHAYATRAMIPFTKDMIIDQKWCYCSYLPNVEDAGFIHIRTKVTPQGPKREKIENYRDLVKRGIIND